MKTIIAFLAVSLLLFACAQVPEQPQQPAQQPSQGTEEPQPEQPVETPPQPEAPSQPAEEPAEPEEPAAEPVAEPEPTETQAPTSERCKDTDVTPEFPDGINFNVAGNITINGKPIINGNDYCPNVATISEWYCLDGAARVKTQRCPSGSCKQGVCT